MITEIRYDELGVSRGIVLREVAPLLSYNGVVQTLVSWDDDAGIACYDDGHHAGVVIVLESVVDNGTIELDDGTVVEAAESEPEGETEPEVEEEND